MVNILLVILSLSSGCFAWIQPIQHGRSLIMESFSSKLSFRRHSIKPLAMSSVPGPLPENYQVIGSELIRKAAADTCGVSSLDIDWKSGVISVVVRHDNVFLSSPLTEEDVDIEDDDDDDEEEGEKQMDQVEISSHAPSNDRSSDGVDVVQLARAINEALDQDDIGLRIAETHEIQVSTPGAPDELLHLLDSPIWEAYKGFEVQTQFMDAKTKKLKTIQGRLHDRTSAFTVINIKGRIKKLKNDQVLSVKLPKAKKEKGVK